MNRGMTNQSPNFESIKQKLSKVSRAMYKTELSYDPVTLLEKSAITGRLFDRKEPVPKRKFKSPPDALSLALKNEHKNREGVKIYHLPKLPFGSHEDYNDEENFVDSHFILDQPNEELSKNLQVLTRKFRLNEKNYRKKAKISHSNTRKRYSSKMDYFKMESGYLICHKEKALTDIYENDKNRYKENKSYHADILSESKKIGTQKKFSKREEDDIINRLHPMREEADSPISMFYKTKYSALFLDSEPSTRPVTSFQIINLKKMMN